MMKSSLPVVAVALLLLSHTSHAQYGDPECGGAEFCSEANMCAANGTLCYVDGCIQAEDGQWTDCVEPANQCGTTSKYCAERYFCSQTAQDCLVRNCESYQKEYCNNSLAEGACSADGSDCPASFTCTMTATTTTNAVTMMEIQGKCHATQWEFWHPFHLTTTSDAIHPEQGATATASSPGNRNSTDGFWFAMGIAMGAAVFVL